MVPELIIRDAAATDVEALALLRYSEHPAVHRDRLRDAADGYLRYLVAESQGNLAGFGLLVFRRPPSWSDNGNGNHLPRIIDLFVQGRRRRQGLGRALLQHMEALAIGSGSREIFLSVNPKSNPLAHTLYQRLGYQSLQAKPYRERWCFVDSDGTVHESSGWAVDMAKYLHPTLSLAGIEYRWGGMSARKPKVRAKATVLAASSPP